MDALDRPLPTLRRPGALTTVDAGLPFEYAILTIPAALELCARCKAGQVYRRGPAQLPYCPRCGCARAGVRYVRADSSSTDEPQSSTR